MLRRLSVLGCFANLAALCLLGLTGVALGDVMFGADVAGTITGTLPPNEYFASPYVDVLNSLYVSIAGTSSVTAVSGLFYAVYTNVLTYDSGVIGPVTSSTLSIIGYVFGGDMFPSGLTQVSSTGQFTAPILSPTAMIYTVTQFTDSGITTSTLTATGLDFANDIPEPSAIAVIVTAVGAVATLAARRRFRRSARRPQ